MKTQLSAKQFGITNLSAALFALIAFCLLGSITASAAPAGQLTIKVIGVAPGGAESELTDNYRWTVEEDATKASVPGVPATSANYSFSLHTSYMPVVAAGRVGTTKAHTVCSDDPQATEPPPGCDPDVFRLYKQTLPELDSNKRYFVSIAAEGYQMGAAPVVFTSTGPVATVYLNQYPVPAAQVSVFAFNDNNPINGAPDLPVETGLAGFTVQLFEAGGTYGQSGGAVTQDGFGNPLGTTYKADGSVLKRGAGIILTDANGVAVIKNLFPAKYTVVVVPPVGSDWHQTSTIEGGKGSDAWVKNNEPSFFQEFGPPGHHVFQGFTRSGKLPIFTDTRTDATTPCAVGVRGCTLQNLFSSTGKITGRVVNTHNSRPPVFTFHNAAPVNDCWVGLNEVNGNTRALYATACNKDSTFTIPRPSTPGTYELVVWDEPLDMIIAMTTIPVGTTDLALGDVPVSSWFGRYQGRVFQDIDGTGLPFFKADFNRPHIEVDKYGVEHEVTTPYKKGELKPPFGEGIANNIRFRDGSIYQSVITKTDGTFAFTELFPFFNYMIAEIDYARFKATGATIVVDEGGKVDPAANQANLWKAEKGLFGSNDPALAYDPWTRLNPQKQADGKFYRNENCDETGGQCAILLEAMQTFLSQTNHIEWGKQPYSGNLNGGIGENGGIAGIVHYAITRAEDDPRYAAAENWEPGIPRVQVNMFLDCDGDGKPDQPMNDGSGQCKAGGLSGADAYVYDKPDVDNYPFGWQDNGTMGPEDDCRSNACKAAKLAGNTTLPFSIGDVFRWGGAGNAAETGMSHTDAWDDNIPRDCPDNGPNGQYVVPSTGEKLDCFDGLRNFNQVRPGVFDGGYAFGRVAGQPDLPTFIGADGKGTYVIEAVAPPGYLHQGNGDKNVVFGDELKASTAALPFACVGMELQVPAELTLFSGVANLNPAGIWRKCDMKAVPLQPGTNPAPDFYMFTEAPVAGHGVGFILDDTATEFNRFAPNFGEKYAPPHMPVSIQDWTGREINRVYSDQFGSYNFLVPSSFTINPPFPSGVMPSMLVACMNHPGPIADPNNPGKTMIDPYFNRKYTQFCYTLQYLAGKTTYLDTPVLPIAAFASVDKNPLDCECAEGTPAIYSATNGDNGPWVSGPGGTLSIVSMGKMDVANPAYDPTVLLDPPSLPAGYSATNDPNDIRLKKNIQRDYGFGATKGTVTLNGVKVPDANVAWNGDGMITLTIPSGTSPDQYQLMITRGDNGKESVVGLAVHVGGPAPIRVNLAGTNGAFTSIQAAIDSINLGGNVTPLITVAPGTYNEYVIMDKRVRLQGWGAGSSFINAAKSSAGGLAAWRAKINAKANVTFDLLPGQTLGIDAANNEPLLFGAEEGPGILVVGKRGSGNLGSRRNCLGGADTALRIDGLTITGSDAGGGILASGYACGLEVSNNRVVANYGTFGGGIRIGHTDLVTTTTANNGNVIDVYTDAVNRQPKIHHNWISQNGAAELGGTSGAGGITLGTGSSNYVVDRNYVCGNFSMGDGGGLSHLGFSDGDGTNNSPANRITNNKFLFNQTFNQSADPMGGGLSIAGQVALAGGSAEGTGDVVVDANLIQGNQAGAGAGGGMVIARTTSSNNSSDDIIVINNMIVNNVAAYTGGGVAITAGTSHVRLVNNTVANNVSTATNRQAFGGNTPQQGSKPQIAGISVMDGTAPALVNNIVWANRSYVWRIGGTDGQTTGLFNPGATVAANGTITDGPSPVYNDLGRVSGNGGAPAATNSIFTAAYTGSGNQAVSASSTTLFVKPNDFFSIIDPTQPVSLVMPTVYLTTALTFDETGNFINVIFSPLTQWDSAGDLRADYHVKAGSVALNAGATSSNNNVPAKDYDGDNRPTNSAVDIGADQIPPAPPTITLTAPLSGPVNGNVNLAATVTNGGSVQRVQFLVDGSVVASDTSSASWNGTWSTAFANNGAKVITAQACGEPTGTCTVLAISAPVNVTVNNPNPLVLTAPTSGATVGGTAVPWSVTVTGLTPSRVQLLIGTTVLTTDSSSNGGWGGNWNTVSGTGATANGTVLVKAQACSNGSGTCNVIATSAEVSVTVANGAASFSPNPVGFGDVVNSSTTVKTVTVANLGPGQLSITNAAVSGSGNGWSFTKTADTCTNATLVVDAQCTINVTFQQSNSNTTRSGTLTITDNGTGAHSVSLSGN